MFLYADDASSKVCGRSVDELESALSTNMNALNTYFCNSQLLLNTNKTKFMQFHATNNKHLRNLSVLCNNKKIDETNSTTFLGLIIDSNLRWDLHIDLVAKKVTSGLYAMYKISKFLKFETLRMIYFAYIHSNIHFGIGIYGATTKKNLDRILLLQKRAIRIMLNLKWRDTVKEHFKNIGILTVYGMYIYEVIVYCKSHFNEFKLVGDNHNYNTRNIGQISIPAHRLQISQKNYKSRM